MAYKINYSGREFGVDRIVNSVPDIPLLHVDAAGTLLTIAYTYV